MFWPYPYPPFFVFVPFYTTPRVRPGVADPHAPQPQPPPLQIMPGGATQRTYPHRPPLQLVQDNSR